MTNCGIYKISFNGSDKIYYGSSNDFDRRKRQHLSDLNNGKHRNPIMQRLFNKCGEDSFKFEVVLECQPDELIEVEQTYLDQMDDATAINLSKTAGGGRTPSLSKEQIIEVFRLRGKENETVENIAKKLDTNVSIIHSVLCRAIASHIEVPQEYLDLAKQNKGDRFSNEDILDMFEMWNSGSTIKEIKEKYNFGSSSNVAQILRREGYSRVEIPQQVIDKAHSRPITDKCFLPTQETIDEIFRLRIEEHLSNNKIGEIFGIPARNVYKILARITFKKFKVSPEKISLAKEASKIANGKIPEEIIYEYSDRHIDSSDIEEVVLGVFTDTAAGLSRKKVGQKYRKSPQWVTDVLKRRTYPNVEIPEELLEKATQRLKKNTGATDEQVIEMFRMFKNGQTYLEIAQFMGISRATAYEILTRRSRKDVIIPEDLVSKD